MIKSFKHKGLQELFENGKTKRVSAGFCPRLLRQMDAINQADFPEQLNFPGYDLHEIEGRTCRFLGNEGQQKLAFDV